MIMAFIACVSLYKNDINVAYSDKIAQKYLIYLSFQYPVVVQ